MDYWNLYYGKTVKVVVAVPVEKFPLAGCVTVMVTSVCTVGGVEPNIST